MAFGLTITGVTAYLMADLVASNPEKYMFLYTSPMIYLIMFSPLIFVLVLSFGINKLSSIAANIIFAIYSAVMGLSLASIFFIFTKTSIASTFFITAGAFLGLAIYGMTTKADLTKAGSYAMMALIGIIIAGLVNLFFQSNTMSLIISAVSVLVFTVLTAYDVQKIMHIGFSVDSESEDAKKLAVVAALSLYLDFINLFLALLRLFGDRR
jgi:FtsH-binding integral membrane protein